jgi:low temperature requirement protein LtrA
VSSADQPVEREQRVTPLELFFDLVFVFAITQVTQLMVDDLSWRGIGRAMLVLAALWWLWTGYAWLTNALEPEEGAVRAGMFAGMAGLFLLALAVPDAFGSEALLFGIAYLVVRLINLAMYRLAVRSERDQLRALTRFTVFESIAPLLIIAAALVEGGWRTTLWLIALAVTYSGVFLGRGQERQISPAHFAERYGLIVIIALGESVVALGVAASHASITLGIAAASVLGIVVIAALWWAYFDVLAVLSHRALARARGGAQTQLARDYYRYLHLPMIAGIVLFALGLHGTIEHVDEPLGAVSAFALCGGLSIYFITHVVQRIRLVYYMRHTSDERPGWIGPGRLVASAAMLLLFPAALAIPALVSLALAAAICCGLIAWDLLHYREQRVEVRRTRP